MKIFEIDTTLYDFLEDHKDEIDYVQLDYKWSPYIAVIETGYYFFNHGYKQELYREVSFSKIDAEYSFYGDVEGAIEFAKNYSVWDGTTIAMDDSILLGEQDNYNYNYDADTPCEASDLEGLDSIEISFEGYVYFDHYKLHRYSERFNGPMYRKKAGGVGA